MPHRTTARSAPRGQATVELVLTLPFVLAVLLLVVQVLLVAAGQLAVDHATREAGRAAAIHADDATVTGIALSGPLTAARTTVRVRDAGDGLVAVEVEYRMPTDVPLVGRFVPDVRLRGAARFRREPGPAPPPSAPP